MEKERCTGCHACLNVCPKSCITMHTDGEGFLYPQIDKQLCIECKGCARVCPALNMPEQRKTGRAYACINKDDAVRMQSSSGGVFTLIAEYVIKNGGVVFGAAFDEDLSVRHIAVRAVDEIGRLRGSKYTQSVIGNSYKAAKELLDSGVPVLFSGTPCQINGLLMYLGRDYDKLITQDLICHGVPSPKVWHKYLEWLSSCRGAAVDKDNPPSFRDKATGWTSYSLSVSFSDKSKACASFSEDPFMKAFLRDLDLRPSCYRCPAKGMRRRSDITLADFWGIEKIAPDMFDNKGTSLVLVNSDKGDRLLKAISGRMTVREMDAEQALSYNPAAYNASGLSAARERFMRLADRMDFDKAVRKSIDNNDVKRALRKLKKIIRKGVSKCSKGKHY